MRGRRVIDAVALLVVTGTLAGCFTLEARLTPNGDAAAWLTYFPPRHATRESELERFSSAHVRVGTFQNVQRFVRVDLAIDDVTALRDTPGFQGVAVTRTRGDGSERLDVTLPGPDARQRTLIDNALKISPNAKGPRVTLTLPGRVLETSPGIRVRGDRIKWQTSLAAYRAAASIPIWVRYSM
jgi:hypothetical protein